MGLLWKKGLSAVLSMIIPCTCLDSVGLGSGLSMPGLGFCGLFVCLSVRLPTASSLFLFFLCVFAFFIFSRPYPRKPKHSKQV